MAKKIAGYIKLQVPAGQANPSPPIGPALGQRGLNIMEFCKAFNARDAEMEPGTPMPVVITVLPDKSFTFITKTPPASYFLKKAARHQVRLQDAGQGRVVGKVTQGPVPRDRRAEDEGPERHDIDAAAHEDCRLRPLHGPRGGGVRPWQSSQSVSPRTREGVDREKLYGLDEAVKLVKEAPRRSSTRPSRSR